MEILQIISSSNSNRGCTLPDGWNKRSLAEGEWNLLTYGPDHAIYGVKCENGELSYAFSRCELFYEPVSYYNPNYGGYICKENSR